MRRTAVPGFGVPDLERVVHRPGDDHPAIGGKSYT